MLAGSKSFLVLVDVAEEHGVVPYDKFMPLIKLHSNNRHKYVVCRFEDIVCNVGLVKCKKDGHKYKVISQHIFKELLETKMGDAKNL